MTGEDAWRAYWKDFADAFAHPLKAGGLLSQFVTNPNVTGAYAEAWIRSIARSMLPQFRISTGAIIRPGDRLRGSPIPQCDIIIWDPSELPALFEQGDFALVPNSAARAVIEIKRSCSDTGELQRQLEQQARCLASSRQRVLGVVISHSRPLFEAEVTPDWLDRWPRDIERAKYPMVRLLTSDSREADVDGIFAFIYFLAQLAGHRHLVVQ